MHWLSAVVIEKARFVRTFTVVVWLAFLLGAILWLGVEKGLTNPIHWLFLTALTLLMAYCWTVLMWHLFVKPQLDAIDQEPRPEDKP